MKRLWVWMLSVCMTLVTACGSLGIVVPKSPKQGYVYAVTANAAVRMAAADALRSGRISEESAGMVLSGTDAARVLLDESLDITGAGAAEEKVADALDLVRKLAAMLKSDGVEVPGI
jgi:hypothetical protein